MQLEALILVVNSAIRITATGLYSSADSNAIVNDEEEKEKGKGTEKKPRGK